MFPSGYWAGGYWHSQYWPAGTAAPVPPSGPVTRLGQIAVGVQRTGDFDGKTAAFAPITRLGQIGIGVERYADFSGKTPAPPEEEIVQFVYRRRRRLRARKRRL